MEKFCFVSLASLLILLSASGYPNEKSHQEEVDRGNSLLCPVSFATNQNLTSDYFTYPLDVFDRDNFKNVSVESLMRCTVFDRYTTGYTPDKRTNHSCSKQQFCPIAMDNVATLSLASDELLLSKPKHNTSICHLHQTLTQRTTKEPINMIAFGGSVTGGYFAGGCKYDLNECVFHQSECSQCTWMSYLGQWFEKHFSSSNVSWHNLARRGHGSAEYEALAIDELKKANIMTLTRNDIIFFDFSTNDNAYYHDYSVETESGLEGLLRNVFSYARDTAIERKVPVSFPTIIFLESDPDLVRAERNKVPVPYYKSYQKISELYHIPIWSYRDVVMSNYSVVNQSSYSNTLKYLDISGNHPGWAHHLFQADLYAAKLLSVFKACDEQEQKLHETKELNVILKRTLRENNEIIQLIESPVTIQRNYTRPCNETAVRVLDYSYQNMVQNRSVLGAWKSHPEGAWQVREDVLGRGGFIRELNYSGRALRHHNKHLNSNNRTASSSVAVGQEDTRIVFTVANITRQQVLKELININLDFKYLRTYHNTGVVFIRYCGMEISLSGLNYRGIKTAHYLDSLWANYKEYRHSLPVMFSVPLKFDNCWFGKQVEGHASTEVTFEIIHKVIDTSKLKSTALVAARDKQKFKFVSIRACII